MRNIKNKTREEYMEENIDAANYFIQSGYGAKGTEMLYPKEYMAATIRNAEKRWNKAHGIKSEPNYKELIKKYQKN